MHIRVGYDIVFDCPAPTPMILMLSVRPERTGDLLTPQIMRVTPEAPLSHGADEFGNIRTRVAAPAGPVRFQADFMIADRGMPDPVRPEAAQQPIEELPGEVLVYLLGSRYCDIDRLGDAAWSLFSEAPPGWPRVQAVCDFVHETLTFGYEFARPTRTASEALEERVGVCRDFAHLAVAFCRCLHIPARYVTGYLGDIGVPPSGPMDFSAWFEAWLDGRWWTFDARHNRPRVGRIPIAIGRDAVDAAISTSFGRTGLLRFQVIAEEAPGRAPSPRQASNAGPSAVLNGASQGP
ncbi:MAG: transglutaminase-like domain-containing protein [Caulobacteraceae bacterium]